MRMSWMAPGLSMERNAVAPIGKPMAFRHIAAEDEHRDVDAVCVRVTRLARAQDYSTSCLVSQFGTIMRHENRRRERA
jgi:hypothetical protein